jgi:transposase InsO family protein
MLLVERVVAQGRPVAHVVKELGCSRQTGYRWLARWREHGPAGLVDRRSGPRRPPRRLSADVEAAVLESRASSRRGPLFIAAELGLAPATVGRVLRRYRVPLLRELDPVTGMRIRSRASDRRYEYDTPGGLIHLDVHKLGRIPDGGGHRAHGRDTAARGRGIGYDFVHVAIDDHSRYAHIEVLPDERGETCAGFLLRAATAFTDAGIGGIQRVLTDNALNYRRSRAFADAVAALGARHLRTRPYCPWTNGKAERLNRTLLTEWAYHDSYLTNTARTAALPAWLDYYNTRRAHTALSGTAPITRVSKSLS